MKQYNYHDCGINIFECKLDRYGANSYVHCGINTDCIAPNGERRGHELSLHKNRCSKTVLAILLESIGRVDLNALANEPTKPLNKLEEMFALLLLESISSNEFEEKNGGDTATTGLKDNSSVLSKRDQEKVFAAAVELALTRASASRLLHVNDTLMQCTAKRSDLSFPLPRTLLTLAQRISGTSLLPPKEYIIDGFDKINKNNNKDKEKEQNGVGCIVSSGKYLFAHGVFGLMQTGTGYHGCEGGKIYQHNQDFYPGEHKSLILLLDSTMTLLFRSEAILPKPFAVVDMSTLKVCEYSEFENSNLFSSSGDDIWKASFLNEYSPAFATDSNLSVLHRIERGGDNDDDYIMYELEWTKSMSGSFQSISGGNQWDAFLTHGGELWISGNNGSVQLGVGHR